jgi:hypothetical protein
MFSVVRITLLTLTVLLAVGVICLGVWAIIPETPPECATAISMESAKHLLVPVLLRHGFSQQETDAIIVTGVVRDMSESWPSYSVQFTAAHRDKTKRYVAMGNGCGVDELFDLDTVH